MSKQINFNHFKQKKINGELLEPMYAPGPFGEENGYGVYYTSDNHFVKYGNFDISQGFTVSCWVRIINDNYDTQYPFCCLYNGNTNLVTITYYSYQDTFYFNNIRASEKGSFLYNQHNVWHHAQVSYNGNTNYILFWWDGNIFANATVPITGTTADAFGINYISKQSGDNLEIYIDDLIFEPGVVKSENFTRPTEYLGRGLITVNNNLKII